MLFDKDFNFVSKNDLLNAEKLINNTNSDQSLETDNQSLNQ